MEIIAPDLSQNYFHFKRQSGPGAPASGTGGYGIETNAGQGFNSTNATIESQRIKRNKMQSKAEKTAESSAYSATAEIVPGIFEELGPAVLGADDWVNATDLDDGLLGSLTLTDNGETGTFSSGGAGALWDAGLLAGHHVMFDGMSVVGNNGIWVPIIDVLEDGTVVFAPGYLANNALDASYAMRIARHIYTPTIYQDNVYSAEMFIGDLEESHYVSDARFTSLSYNDAATAYPTIGFGLVARALRKLDGTTTPTAPAFTSVSFPSGSSIRVRETEGGIYVNGVRRLNLTTLTLGIAAQTSNTQLIANNDGTAPKKGNFGFSGTLAGVLDSHDDLTAYKDSDVFSALIHLKARTSERGVGLYFGNLEFGGFTGPGQGAGDAVQSLVVYGGDDDRGPGHAATTILISDLAETGPVNS